MAVYCKALGVYLGLFLNRGTEEQGTEEYRISNIEQGISNVEGRETAKT